MSDLDPRETREWLDALDPVVVFDGADQTTFLLDGRLNGARHNGVPVPYSANTPNLNTIPPVRETPHPGDQEIEYKIRSLIRWKGDPVGGVHRPEVPE
jgi:pyruvate dehydrogenase E1 component